MHGTINMKFMSIIFVLRMAAVAVLAYMKPASVRNLESVFLAVQLTLFHKRILNC
jgi:hypothetical protein